MKTEMELSGHTPSGTIGKAASEAATAINAVVAKLRKGVPVPRGEVTTTANLEASNVRGLHVALVKQDLIAAAKLDLDTLRYNEIDRLTERVERDKTAWEEGRKATAEARHYIIADEQRRLETLTDGELQAECAAYAAGESAGDIDNLRLLAARLKQKYERDPQNMTIATGQRFLLDAMAVKRASAPWTHSDSYDTVSHLGDLTDGQIPTADSSGRRGRISFDKLPEVT